MTNATDALLQSCVEAIAAKLAPQRYGLDMKVKPDGPMMTYADHRRIIEGIERALQDPLTVRAAMIRGQIATPAGSAEGVANLAVKVAGEAQRWHERAIAAEAEAARLREALRLVDANTTRADWPEDIFTAIRSAAMGSANGQADAADTTAGDAEPEARG